jgi:hypothetical protein
MNGLLAGSNFFVFFWTLCALFGGLLADSLRAGCELALRDVNLMSIVL